MTNLKVKELPGQLGPAWTSLLNLIGCLDRRSEGVIRLDGKELSKLSKPQLADIRRRRLGFIFQSYNLIPVLTAYENIEFSLALLGNHTTDIRSKVMKILADVGLEGLESRRPGDLSGG